MVSRDAGIFRPSAFRCDHVDKSHTGGTGGGEEESEAENKGTLLLDATCAPADIKSPTDVSLLKDARQMLEDMIKKLHQQSAAGEKKPRTYK